MDVTAVSTVQPMPQSGGYAAKSGTGHTPDRDIVKQDANAARPERKRGAPLQNGMQKEGALSVPRADRFISEDALRKESEQAKEGEAQDIADAVNDFMEHINTALHFSVHKDTEQLVMKVVNQKNGEVVKEIPAEEMLDLMARIQERIGVLLDKKV